MVLPGYLVLLLRRQCMTSFLDIKIDVWGLPVVLEMVSIKTCQLAYLFGR